MWNLLLIALILVKAILSEYSPTSVVLGPTPEVNRLPDLSEITDKHYTCLSIKGSTACPGFDVYVPKTGYYGYESGNSDFSKYVLNDVQSNTGYINAICPEKPVDTSKIAYRYSLYCGRLIYSQARWCKQNPDNVRANPQLSVCKRVCLQHAQSILDYSENYCQNTDHSVAQKIYDNIKNKWCSIFSDEPGCVNGTTTENNFCGYQSETEVNDATLINTHNDCWSSPETAATVLEDIKKKASEIEVKKMGSIKWKIAYPLVTMVIIGIGTFVFWKRQNEKYKLGYIPENNSDDGYEILPSNVEPSRDYIDEDFIKNEIEFPKSTLTRKSSFAVSTLSRISRAASSKSNVLYMVAIYNYHAKMDDELELKAGDRIRVEHKYDDG